jgi:hypothetical protein
MDESKVFMSKDIQGDYDIIWFVDGRQRAAIPVTVEQMINMMKWIDKELSHIALRGDNG